VKRLGDVIAVRRFHQPPTNRAVTVRIGQPRRSGRDWLTPVEIRGLGPVETHYVYGVDGIQALDGPAGDLGLPRQLPDLGVPDLRARLDRAVDRELSLWAAAVERDQRRRRRSHRPRAQQ